MGRGPGCPPQLETPRRELRAACAWRRTAGPARCTEPFRPTPPSWPHLAHSPGPCQAPGVPNTTKNTVRPQHTLDGWSKADGKQELWLGRGERGPPLPRVGRRSSRCSAESLHVAPTAMAGFPGTQQPHPQEKQDASTLRAVRTCSQPKSAGGPKVRPVTNEGREWRLRPHPGEAQNRARRDEPRNTAGPRGQPGRGTNSTHVKCLGRQI